MCPVGDRRPEFSPWKQPIEVPETLSMRGTASPGALGPLFIPIRVLNRTWNGADTLPGQSMVPTGVDVTPGDVPAFPGHGGEGVGGRAEGSPRPTAGSEPTYSGCRPRGQVAPVRAALAGEPHDVAVE